MRNHWATVRYQTFVQGTGSVQCRQSRLAIPSQNKKRSNATAQNSTLRCFTFYFAQPHKYNFTFYLCPMKLLTFLLAIYVLTLSTVPCYMEDKCLNETHQTEQSQNQTDEQGCSDCCSPFVSCGTCCGFTFTFTTFTLQPNIISYEKKFTFYKQTFNSQFAPSIWQPPKLG